MKKNKDEFIISSEQIEKLRPYLPDIDSLVCGDLDLFEDELNDAIVYHLDSKNGYEETEISMFLQDLYDEIYNQNKK